MSLNPIVSVITTCYNDGKYLQECIDSVRVQTYPNIEHIIIDDGSTDANTLELLQKLRSDPDFKIITTSNQGVCKARNQAINSSKGLYILPLDSDDIISPIFVELAVEKLNKDENVKLVASNYKLFGRVNRTVVLEEYSIEKLMGHNLFVVTTMFRRKDFDSVGGFNINMKEGLEDWDFWLSIMKTGGKVNYLEGVNFFYRMKPVTESRNANGAAKNHSNLRRQMWQNNSDLYSQYYPNPLEMLEYLNILNSKEYRLGKMILFPVRKFLNLFSGRY
ncbi:glycosyltransferase [Flavobacterium saccharophilum]|uniref:Glycosyltransferase involved in cell wall bisynthesis n=1 Tax=Flavobacterium saccharophilum TaxID=29534 RepID=A0A1M7KA23_9FLAO|nr:glycosyltransferase [Flavobacterium saccharophilum]SHM62031.1 Glycosyltransferase involved in cell wall bisynthesis [Flavobacterium saccharophilum]